MLQAKTLMIGNLVVGASRGKVEIVDSGIIKAIDQGKAVYVPIPLTFEWLCKTEAQLQPWGWVLNGILIRTNHKDKFWIELGNGKKIELPYVHSLQNFFTLANEELTFKL